MPRNADTVHLKNLASLMHDRNAAEVARIIGIHSSSLNQISKLKRGSSLHVAHVLADYLGVSIEMLIGSKPDGTPIPLPPGVPPRPQSTG